MSRALVSVGVVRLPLLDRPYDGRGTDVDYRVKANRPTDRDANVNAGKTPAAGDQRTFERSRILTGHVQQQLQLLLDGEFASVLVSSEAANGDSARRIEGQPAHISYRELAEQRRRVQRHEVERADDLIKRAEGAVASLKTAALERAACEQTVRVDLGERHWRGAHREDGVVAYLAVHGDRHFDFGKRRRSCHQAAFNMLHLVTAHLEVERELLLKRELAADFVGAPSGDGGVGAANRHEPVHVGDRVGFKQTIETRRREDERSLDRHSDHDRTKTGRKASPLEGAVLVQAVKGARLGAGGSARSDYSQKEQHRGGKIHDG